MEYRQELAELTSKLAAVQQKEECPVVNKTRSIVQKFESTTSQSNITRSNSFIDSRVKQLESELQTEKKLLREKEAEIHELQRQVDILRLNS